MAKEEWEKGIWTRDLQWREVWPWLLLGPLGIVVLGFKLVSGLFDINTSGNNPVVPKGYRRRRRRRG